MSVVLSEHLPLLASAPNGIRKVRGLILELAVRGKLVQSSGVYGFVTFGSICNARSGNGKLIKGKLHDSPTDGLFPCFSASGQDVWHTEFEYEGDAVILSAVGARCGKAFIAKDKWSAIANTHILFPNTELCTVEYLHLISNNERFWLRGGSAQPFVKVAATLRERSIYCPPISEQHRIVAKVDELMALCDRLEAEQADAEAAHAKLVETLLSTLTQSTDAADLAANWQRLAEHFDILFATEASLDTLKQTILQLAVMGKLVPQNPNDEPASELLKRIAKERARLEAEGICKKSKAMPLEGEGEQPYCLPEGWKWVRLPDVCHVITDGEHITPQYSDSGVPMLSAKHLGTDTLLFEDLKFVTPSVADKCWSRCCPEERDILVVSRGGGVGRTIISSARGYCLMGSVLLFKPATEVNERYLRSYLCSNEGNEKLRTTSGASAQQAIYIAHLKRDYLLPLPPLAEQHRIVAKVDELLALCDRLKTDLAESRSQQERLAATLIESALQAA